MTAEVPSAAAPSAPEGTSAHDGPARSLPHVAALDGLRGLAVLGVLAFHAELGWARGGFLGVSLFFTLSGLLITSLLLAERRGSGRVALGAFWARRLRRLLPAALATVALVVVLVGVAGDDAARRDLPGDATATVGYVANWHALAEGRSYGALFSTPSPLVHTWSLAIEEQAYVVLPLLLLAVGALLRRRRHDRALHGPLAVVLGAAAVASVALGAAGVVTGDRAYYGTDARAAELLAGALLACWIAGRRFDDPVRSPVARTALAIAGPAALLALLGAWAVVDQRSSWLARGGFAVHAGLACVVLAAALVPDSPIRRLLAARPLVAAGLLSYGLYLYHWPLFWWLSPERTGLDGPALVALRLGATVAVAVASYRWLEQPIRRGWRPALRVPVAAVAGAGALAVVAAALAVPVVRPVAEASTDLDVAAGSLASSLAGLDSAADALTPTGLGAAPDADPPTGAPARPRRVLVLGDSTAWYLTTALDRWGSDTGTLAVAGHARLGCGLLRTERRTHLGREAPTPPECNAWPTEWPAAIAEARPDLVVIASGWWEAADAQPLEGTDELLAPGDPAYDDAVVADWGRAADLVHQAGVPVVWLDLPPVGGDPEEPRPHGNAVSDPDRIDRLNELLAEVAADRPWLTVVPYRRLYLDRPEGPLDPALRPDGLHVDGEAAWDEVGAWLGPRLLAAAVTAPR